MVLLIPILGNILIAYNNWLTHKVEAISKQHKGLRWR